MGLSTVQTRARRWLCSNYGIKQEDISVAGATLTTAEGNFTPKLVVGNENKVAVFFPSEMEKLMEEPDKNRILFVPQGPGEIVQMSARAFRESPEEYRGIRLVHRGPNMATGENGEILLHLSKRTVNSNHYRINHVPMDSMLIYRDYTAHLSVSMASGNIRGKPDFWLSLRPENFGV